MLRILYFFLFIILNLLDFTAPKRRPRRELHADPGGASRIRQRGFTPHPGGRRMGRPGQEKRHGESP
ncbi:MAG TPA: hypothetical protein VHC70_12880 [Phycisphaerales bacterium]|nr:hypothetical protein [Phycisphaerales bacterium]